MSTPAKIVKADPNGTALAKPSDVRLDKMTLASAKELCTKEPDTAAALLMSVIANNTLALPDTAFVRRDDVFIKKVKQTVTLTERDKHLLPTKVRRTVPGGKDVYETTWNLTMDGIRRLNEVPALQILRPEYVIVNGTKQMNPYIQVDPASKMPEVVYARCLCVGYSPTGSLVATDAMVRLDVGIYLLENLQAKMGRMDNPDLLGQYGSADEKPTNDAGKALPGKWRFLPLHSVGGIGLWVNLASPVTRTILADHTTRVKFIERLAQSFAERNAMKSHPAIPKTIRAERGIAFVTVSGWTTDFDRKEIERLREMIEQNRVEDFRDKAGKPIDTIAVDVTDMSSDDVAALNEDANDQRTVDGDGDNDVDQTEHEQGEDEGDVAEAATAAAASQSLMERAIAEFSRVTEIKSRSAAKQLVKDAGASVLDEATDDQLEAFLKACESIK